MMTLAITFLEQFFYGVAELYWRIYVIGFDLSYEMMGVLFL